jgi:hypothetical protein
MIESVKYFPTVPNALIRLGMNALFFAQPATGSSPSSRFHTTTDFLVKLDVAFNSFTGLSVASSSLVWPVIVAKLATSLDKIAGEFLCLDIVTDSRF